MIDHLPFRLLAAAAVSDELDDGDAARFARHVADCAACRAESAALRRDHRALANLAPLPVSAHVRAAVLDAARGRQSRPGWALLAAAALLLVAAAGTILAAGYLMEFRRAPAIELTGAWQVLPPGTIGSEATTSRARSVVATGEGFVAVGSIGDQAAVWFSTDGLSWEPARRVAGGQGAELTAVELGADGLVAAGRAGAASAIWHSPDGRQWTMAGPRDALADASIHAIVPSRAGWRAVGAAVGPRGLQGASWVSENGLDWRRSLPSNLPVLAGAIEGPDGGWIATTGLATDGLLVSPDGLGWTPFGETGDVRTATRIVRADLGYVAIRADGRAWWSADGASWVAAAEPERSRRLEDAVDLSGTVVLTGSDASGAITLRTTDGLAYALDPLPSSGAGTVYDIAMANGIEVAVGIDGQGAAIWVRRR